MENSHGYNYKLFVSVFESKTENGKQIININSIRCQRPNMHHVGDYYAVYVDNKHDIPAITRYMKSLFSDDVIITVSAHIIDK